MKKLLFLAATVAMLATSCENTEVLNEVKNPMGFQAGIGKQTKALAATGAEQLQNQGFKLWAFASGTASIYSGIADIKVSYDNESGKWGAERVYYWPGTDKSLDFYAVSQDETADNGAGAVTIDNGANTVTVTVTDFTVMPSADNDLMIAAKITQAENDRNNKTTIKPVFAHTLTKVAINFKQDETSYNNGTNGAVIVVNSISTSNNLTNKGTCTRDEKAESPITWTLKEASTAAYSITADSTLTSTSKNYATWLLLPQTLTDKTVTINYTVNGIANEKTFDLLQSDKIDSWGINQFVSYNITISPNAIAFEPSVGDWVTNLNDPEINQ